MKKIVLSFFTLALVISCKNPGENPQNQLDNTAERIIADSSETDGVWQYLFDGSNADGWRSYNGNEGEGLPDGWVIEGETLKSLGKGGDIGGDIVYADKEFGEFELFLEWKISPGGNSGVFYHVIEDEKYHTSYVTGPEYQIIDQTGFPRELEPWQSIGADYGMYDPEFNEEDLKEVGEWNSTRIRFTEDKVTYWLNGEITVEFEPWSEDWRKRKNEGKWKDYPDYGEAKSGLITLQDHGSYIWFKNIKIKEL